MIIQIEMAITNFAAEDIQRHSVFNELDSHGLTLNLPRLTDEKNAEYKQRLLDVFVRKANSGYLGLIQGITRELGLSIRKEFTITPTNSSAYPYAAVVFKDTRCCIYANYYEDPILEIDRWSLGGEGYTLQELKDKIQNTTLFSVANMPGINLSQRSMTVYEQSSIRTQLEEPLSGKGHVVNLENQNLIKDKVYISSSVLKTELPSDDVTPLANFRKGEYRIDYEAGQITCAQTPGSGSFVRYDYRDNEFVVKSSPVILSNLQVQGFRKYLFKQIEQMDNSGNPTGLYENGSPTPFGADIINELLSVFPTTYKA